MKKSLVLVFMLTPVFAWAQSISGTVADSNGQSIAFANVALCQSNDSTIIDGCTSNEDGKFNLTTDGLKGKYLRISFVGYKTKFIELSSSPLHVTLEPLMLDEVIIKNRRKLFEQKYGEITARVKGTILEALPKTADVIAQLPFVSRQGDDFTVFGKGKPIIYINNRLVQDMKELDRLMPSQIKNITVDMMPGSKYDASVSSVIRITTEKVQGEGLSGTLYGVAKHSRRWSTEEYADLNYRHNAWDIFGSAYLMQNRNRIDFNSNQQMDVANGMHNVTYQEKENYGTKYIGTTTGVNFNPNEKISAGMQYIYLHNTYNDYMMNNICHVLNNEEERERQQALIKSPTHSHNINAYFSGKLTSALSLDVNMDWMKGKEKKNMYSWFPGGNSSDVNTANNRHYDYYASKAVFTYGGKSVNLEGGGEYIRTDMTQTYDISNTSLGINNSNDVTKQNRWALFANAKTQLGHWGFGAGLRYEDIDLNYYMNEMWNKEQSRAYHKLFPNVLVNYSKDNVQATLGYERKIQYPTYSQLRSEVQYSSPYLYESGNANLLPQMQNAFTLLFGYKDIKAMLGYTIYEDYMVSNMELFNGNPIVLMKTMNMDGIKNRSFAVSYSPTVGIWQPTLEMGGNWQDFSLAGKKYDKPIFNIKLNNMLSFPHDWYLTANIGWQSKGNSEIYLYKSSLQTYVDISKLMFNRNLMVSLTVNDIFKSDKTRWNINHNHIVMNYDKYNDSRYVQLTIRYDFNTTNSKYKGDSSSDEKNRLK